MNQKKHTGTVADSSCKISEKKKRSPVAAICSTLGTVLLILLILCCIPLTVPRWMGYEVYTVISGSMEPEIPVGRLVFIGEAQPPEVEAGDVIAYYGGPDSNAVITHRVVENRVIMGEFITKGDANEEQDRNPIDYGEFIGRVKYCVPKLGILAQMLTAFEGKVAAGCMIGLSVVLHLLAAVIEEYRNKRNILSHRK